MDAKFVEFLTDSVYLAYILRVISTALSALGIVYIFHRMLNIRMTYRQTNILALIVMLIWSWAIQYVFWWDITPLAENIYMALTFFAISCVPYVVIGWRLFSRMDSYLDKKIGKDMEPKRRKRSKSS